MLMANFSFCDYRNQGNNNEEPVGISVAKISSIDAV